MLPALALLPLGTIVLAAYALRPTAPVTAPLRLAVMRGGVVVGAVTVGSVEVLGALDALTRPVVAVAWSLALLLALAAAGYRWRSAGRPRHRPLNRLREGWRGAGRWERVLGAGLVGLMLAELLIALLSPPNNYDSMSYHLPKIEHWVVQHNVGFYATRIHRQNSFAPGAEYLLLQLRLLTGGNVCYNLVQWSAGVGCVLAASRIAAQLGGSRRAQLLAAFVVGTTPMVALESSSTQTDLVVAAWVACLGTLVLDEVRRRSGPLAVLLLGGAAGLVTLTKATGLLGAGPLLLLWGLAQLRLAHSAELHTMVRRTARTVLASAGIVLVAALLAGPFLHRTQQEFGNPLGPGYSRQSISMERHDPAAVLVNAARVMHTLFDTPIAPLSRATARMVTGGAHVLHVNPEDPKITFVDASFPFKSWRPDEDSVSYPVQAGLVLIGAAFVAVRPRRVVPGGQSAPARSYALAFWLAVLLYPIVIKWQPWGNRLFLYALVMGGPLAGLWLDSVLRKASRAPVATAPAEEATGAADGAARRRVPGRRRVAAWAALLALVVGGAAGWLSVGYGWPRRLVGGGSVFTTHGTKALFNRREQWRPDYEYVAAQVRASGAERIGLAQDANSWEYPWWYLLPGTNIEALQTVMPHHPAAKPAEMDAVICTVSQPVCSFAYVPPGWTLHWHGTAGYALPPGR